MEDIHIKNNTVNYVESQQVLLHQRPEIDQCFGKDTFDVFASASRVQLTAGTQLFRESDSCQAFMWLMSGTLRVFKHSKDGREVTLYRVQGGEFCILSLQCLLSKEKAFPAESVVENDLQGIVLSEQNFHRAMDEYSDFRRYILKMLSNRVGAAMKMVSDVTFQQLDLRLACLLGQRFRQSGGQPLKTTHMQLARELGTTREVVSRILKGFEHHYCIGLSRGQIHLVSQQSLDKYSSA